MCARTAAVLCALALVSGQSPPPPSHEVAFRLAPGISDLTVSNGGSPWKGPAAFSVLSRDRWALLSNDSRSIYVLRSDGRVDHRILFDGVIEHFDLDRHGDGVALVDGQLIELRSYAPATSTSPIKIWPVVAGPFRIDLVPGEQVRFICGLPPFVVVCARQNIRDAAPGLLTTATRRILDKYHAYLGEWRGFSVFVERRADGQGEVMWVSAYRAKDDKPAISRSYGRAYGPHIRWSSWLRADLEAGIFYEMTYEHPDIVVRRYAFDDVLGLGFLKK